jgi:hypothetical protein
MDCVYVNVAGGSVFELRTRVRPAEVLGPSANYRGTCAAAFCLEEPCLYALIINTTTRAAEDHSTTTQEAEFLLPPADGLLQPEACTCCFASLSCCLSLFLCSARSLESSYSASHLGLLGLDEPRLCS